MTKIRAVIQTDSGTLLVDFPQGIYDLYEKLHSVGIRHSPSNIPIVDEEGGAIRVKLYAEDDVGKRLALLFSENDTLAEVNTTAYVVENADPEIKPQLEENLLHGQYSRAQELIYDVREMTYALGPVQHSYFCPLCGSIDDGEYEDLCDVDNRFLRDYAWAIQEKLEEDQAAPEDAVARFFHDEAGVKAKLVSAVWNVEEYKGILYGKIECRFKEELTDMEEEILKSWISGQCSDGYGEHFEQQPIPTEDGDLFVSFWHSGDDYFLCSEKELDACIKNARQKPRLGDIWMEKYIEILMQQQAERKKVDEIDIRQFPELIVNWVSDHKMQTETVSSNPAALAECVMRHREDGELSIRSQNGVEVMRANSGYVLMARDMKYWAGVNEQLHQIRFAENRETGQDIEDSGMEMGRM